MIPNPIRRVLSSIHAHRVRALLMGGQACVLYGGAEFSRDTDLVLLADADNLTRLRRALVELQGEVIAVPPLRLQYLQRGHAIHFRCLHPDLSRMRVDVMSRLRGVGTFPGLWRRRTTIRLPDGFTLNVLSLPDLVQAKKTQRDKDWPMLRRLMEAHYFEHRDHSTPARVRFWMLELRTPELLIDLTRRHRRTCAHAARKRPLLQYAARGDQRALEEALRSEVTVHGVKTLQNKVFSWRAAHKYGPNRLETSPKTLFLERQSRFYPVNGYAARKPKNVKPTGATGSRCARIWSGCVAGEFAVNKVKDKYYLARPRGPRRHRFWRTPVGPPPEE